MLILGVAVASSALTAAAIVLPAEAGDGSGGGDRLKRLEGGGGDRVKDFEACMREQGFELGPETTVRITPDGVTVNGEAVDRDEFREAKRECGPLFPHVGPSFEPGELPDDMGERFERLRDCLEGDDI